MRDVEPERILCFPVSSVVEAGLILHLLPVLGCKVLHPCNLDGDIVTAAVAWFAENGITLQRESLKTHVVLGEKGAPGQLRVNLRDLGIQLDGKKASEMYVCGVVFTEADRGPILIGLTAHMCRELAQLLRRLTDLTTAVQDTLAKGLIGQDDGRLVINGVLTIEIENETHPQRNGHQ